MSPETLAGFSSWFEGYAAGFLTGDPGRDAPLRLKIQHTGRVREDIRRIGEGLDLPESDLLIAEATALFHDLGRFRQYTEHGTFRDVVSVNHAHLGLREMARHRVLDGLPREERRLIRRAVAFHNARAVPEKTDDRSELFMRLIRDADKMDIWQVFVDHYRREASDRNSVVVMEMPDLPSCSPAVIEDLGSRRIARLSEIATLTDLKLLQISWVFDVNFPPTFRLLRDRGHIDAIAGTLPDLPGIAEAVAAARSYLQQQS